MVWLRKGRGLMLELILGLVCLSGVWTWDRAYGIEVDITLEKAKNILAVGRQQMENAKTVEDVAKVMKAADQAIRIGADPEKDPCGAHATLKTRHFWLEYFGRREAAESKRQSIEVRMPDSKIQEILEMPYLEIEVRLCGEEEFFADGAQVALQQGSHTIHPVDIGPAERGRKNPGSGPVYRSRFSARFAYSDFDPIKMTAVAVFFPDGKLMNIEADFSKIK